MTSLIGLLAVLAPYAAGAPGAATRSALCAPVSFEDTAYTVCEAPLDRYAIETFWRKPDGTPYNYLSALPKTDAGGARLAFALNGGMFDPEYKPVGLYVEGGRELTHVNTRNGTGNFHLKPNGVFYASSGAAGVMETGAYLKKNVRPEFATQSGPMLVIDGKPHPRIANAASSAKPRDGVCVRDGKTVIFAISDGDVPFRSFVRFFRLKLGCKNALFLDGGSAPALYVADGTRSGNSFVALGPMIGVYEKP